MRRREFITLLGGAAAAWPVVARAQQPARMRRIGVLLPATSDDSEYQAWVGAFLQGLALLGWTIGRNVRIDTRWATANADEIRKHATELVALAPDEKKRVNLYGMHPIFSGGGAPKENRWARLRSVPLACVRHFADLSRS